VYPAKNEKPLSNFLAGLTFPHVGPFPWKETVFELARCPHPFRRAHGLILLFIPGFGFGERPRFFDNPLHIPRRKATSPKSKGKAECSRTYSFVCIRYLSAELAPADCYCPNCTRFSSSFRISGAHRRITEERSETARPQGRGNERMTNHSLPSRGPLSKARRLGPTQSNPWPRARVEAV